MAKVWKDADEVIKMVHELPSNKLREIDKEMSKGLYQVIKNNPEIFSGGL